MYVWNVKNKRMLQILRKNKQARKPIHVGKEKLKTSLTWKVEYLYEVIKICGTDWAKDSQSVEYIAHLETFSYIY